MNNLPHDITSNILSRLPLRSVLQCKSVCKTWCSLISVPQFANIHLNRAIQTNPNPNIIILHSCNKTGRNELYFVEDNEAAKEEFKEPIARATRIDVPFILESSFRVIGSCNGLLCLSSTHNGNQIHPIYIFNPATREHMKLPDLTIPPRVFEKSLLGFGFCVSTHEFKVVQVLFFKDESSSSQHLESVVQVYTIGSNSWRRIGNAPDMLSGYVHTSTFSNGSLHWMMSSSLFSTMDMVSFDLSVEEFGVVPKPKFRPAVKIGHPTLCYFSNHRPDVCEVVNHRRNSYSTCYRLGELGGCLSVVDSSSDFSIDMWVMRSYNVKESWIIHFSIRRDSLSWLDHGFITPVCLRRNGEILLMYDWKDLVSYNAESQELSILQVVGIEKLSDDLESGRHATSFLAFPLVGSLISPKSTSGLKVQQ